MGGPKRLTVAALDLGIKAMTPHRMAERGIEVHVLPATATARRRAARSRRPRRAVLLQRPRRPGRRRPTGRAAARRRWSAGVPYFGICFGNQLFGRALGLGTYKLTYGHRGINQPVMDRTTGKVEVTAHNHGFAVDWPEGTAPTDDAVRARPASATSASTTTSSRASSCGTRDGGLRAFSVQYHPEAAAGPHDAAYLFDRFVELWPATRRPTAKAGA